MIRSTCTVNALDLVILRFGYPRALHLQTAIDDHVIHKIVTALNPEMYTLRAEG